MANPPHAPLKPSDGLAYLHRAINESHGTLKRMEKGDEKLTQARAELHERPEAMQTTRRLQTEMAIRELTAIGVQRRKERSESIGDSGTEMTNEGNEKEKQNANGGAVHENGGGKMSEDTA